jgi:hypothetical protein
MKWKELFDRLGAMTIKSIVADLQGYEKLPEEIQVVLEKAKDYLELTTEERDVELLINKNKKGIRCLMQQIKNKNQKIS